MYTIEVAGYSDDIVLMEIHHGDVSVHENEYGIKNTFSINDHLSIHTFYGSGHGWIIGVSIDDENYKIDETYKIDLIQSKLTPYSPILKISSAIPIAVKGIYGDKESAIKNVLSSWFEESQNVNGAYNELKAKKLI